jgi:hypothetical protein
MNRARKRLSLRSRKAFIVYGGERGERERRAERQVGF